MNCRDIEEFSPLYFSGELEDARRALLETHLAQCRSCAMKMNRQAGLDARLREAVSTELPDATMVARSVRKRIAQERPRRFAAVAAAVLCTAALGYWALRPEPVARFYADAALDHRLEVMEHQPRHWRSDPGEVEKLAARFALSNAGALAPTGYHLEHAKVCGLEGKPALHLVYTNGNKEFSVYVRERTGGGTVPREVRVGSEELVGFQTERWEAVVATGGSRSECLEFARVAERVL